MLVAMEGAKIVYAPKRKGLVVIIVVVVLPESVKILRILETV